MTQYNHTYYGRLTAHEAYHKGFLPAIVMLNGKEIIDCVEFDDIEGWADINILDENDSFVLDDNDNIVTKRLHGNVVYLPNLSETSMYAGHCKYEVIK